MVRSIDAPVRPGDILAGKYRVEKILGAGNMGVVVAVTHVGLDQRVALKFMLAEKGAEPELRARFLREARAAGRLRSQHVARVLDVGTLDNEAPYIVMELLEGQDLAALLKARGPLPFNEAVEYVLQACEAVGEAHAAGIVHRDLKPANLFRTEDVGGSACIKVLDFGISKLSGVDFTLTDETEMLGSPLYMSPEQMRSSKGADARSDIWSLGVVLYQLVAGRTPFYAKTITQVFSCVSTGEPTPLANCRSDAPPGFEAVLLTCLSRDREQRWPSVAAFAAALAPFAPEHARAYPRRVARVLGSTSAPAVCAPELLPAPSMTKAAPTVGGTQAAQLGEASTLPAPQPLPAPRTAAPSAPSEVSDTATTLSASQNGPRRAARPGVRAGVGAALGVVSIGAFVLSAVGLRSALQPSPAASTEAEPPAATQVLDPSPAASAQEAPEEPRVAAPTPTGAPSASAVADPAPRVSPESNPPGRAAGARIAAPASVKPPLARPPAAPAAAPALPKRRGGMF